LGAFEAWPATEDWPANGDRVLACYLATAPLTMRRSLSKKRRTGAGRWFAGTVVVRHPDGLCDILYDCGVTEKRVVSTSIIGGALADARATNTNGEAVDEAMDEQCIVADESDDEDDDLRSLHTEMTDGPASFTSTSPSADILCAGAQDDQDDQDDQYYQDDQDDRDDRDDRDDGRGTALNYLADVCARALAAEIVPPPRRPVPQKPAKEKRDVCIVEGCARRPFVRTNTTFPGMCGECIRIKYSSAKMKCVEQGCEQMRRHDSGRCRLCEGRAAVSTLPMCVVAGCGRRLLARGEEPPERCLACLKAAPTPA